MDGQDVIAVNAAATRMVNRARDGKGPAFLLCNTYRYRGHHVGDINREYRSKQEEQTWSSQRDPIKIFGDYLVAQKLADPASLDAIAADVKTELAQAVEFAINAAYPAVEQAEQDVYA